MLFNEFIDLNFFWGPFCVIIFLTFKLNKDFLGFNVNTNNVTGLPHETLYNLILNLWIAFFFFIVFSSSYTGGVFFNFYVLSTFTFNWFILIWLISLLALMALNSLLFNNSFNSSPEFFLSLFFIIFLWSTLPMVSTFFSFLIYLELSGLCLLLLFVSSDQNTSADYFNKNSTNTNVLSSCLLFLWVSILSTLLLLLSLNLCIDSIPTQLDIANIFINFQPFNNTLLHLFFISVFLNVMLLPWQLLIFSFYNTISLQNFSLYMAFYYPAFLLLSPYFFSSFLVLSSAQFLIFWGSGLILTFVLTLFFFANLTDLNLALAVSSIFNFIVIFTLYFL